MPAQETSTQRSTFTNCLPASVAVIATYCVYYLRHPSTIHDFSTAGGSVAIGCAALVGLAIISGFVTNAMKPRTTTKAFSIGFALPAVLFATDVKEVSSHTQNASVLSIAPLFQKSDTRPNAFSTALALVFAPVSSVSESTTASAVRKEVAMRSDLEVALSQARSQVENTNQQLMKLSAGKTDVEATLAQLRRESQANQEKFTKEFAALQAGAENVKSLRDRVDAALSKTPEELEHLRLVCSRSVETWKVIEPVFAQITLQVAEARRLVAK